MKGGAVVMYSGGLASYEAAIRTIARFGRDSTTLLFADTTIEHPDLYRFLDDSEVWLGVEKIVRVADGRDPWQVFRDIRFIGNARAAPCSRILKRDVCDKWLAENRDPATTVVVLGLDWTETHRIEGTESRYTALGWRTWFPLNEPPLYDKRKAIQDTRKAGLRPPELYDLGFEHNNCGGFCVRAGAGHFGRLLAELPDVYQQHEREERGLVRLLGKDVSILRDRRGGTTKPLTLAALRQRIQKDAYVPDPTDVGGCGCFSDDQEDDL